MEIIIGLLVVAALAFYLIRKNKEVEVELQTNESAPESAKIPMVVAGNPVMPTEVGKSADDRVESTAPHKVPEPVETAPAPVVAEEIQWPKVEAPTQPAKKAPRARKPAEPQAPAKPKAVPAKSTKTKAPAIKATPAKKPRAPRAK